MEVTTKANELIETVLMYTDLTVDECIETIRDDPYFSSI
jgi:hypothetical protein